MSREEPFSVHRETAAAAVLAALIFGVATTTRTMALGSSSPTTSQSAGPDDPAGLPAPIRQLKVEWERDTAHLPGNKLGAEKRNDIAHSLVAGLDAAGRRALCSWLAKPDPELDAFSESMTSALIDILVEEHNREALTEFLSKRCPDRVYFRPTEFFIAFYGDNAIDAPLLVFCDAFDRAKSEESRHQLASILRRAFLQRDVAGKGDEEVIRFTREWYRVSGAKCRVNEGYDRHGMNDESGPLLIPKQ